MFLINLSKLHDVLFEMVICSKKTQRMLVFISEIKISQKMTFLIFGQSQITHYPSPQNHICIPKITQNFPKHTTPHTLPLPHTTTTTQSCSTKIGTTENYTKNGTPKKNSYRNILHCATS
jgi:hypothetical protein